MSLFSSISGSIAGVVISVVIHTSRFFTSSSFHIFSPPRNEQSRFFFSPDNGVALVVTYEVYFTSPSLPFLLSFFTSIEMLWELYIHYFCLCFIFILSHSLKIAVVPVSLEMQCDMYIFYTLAYHLNIIQK